MKADRFEVDEEIERFVEARYGRNRYLLLLDEQVAFLERMEHDA